MVLETEPFSGFGILATVLGMRVLMMDPAAECNQKRLVAIFGGYGKSEDPVRVSRQHLPQSHGGIRHEA